MLRKRADLAALLTFAAIVLALSCTKNNPECPNAAPTASFTVNPTSGTADTVFQCDASSCSDAEDPVSAIQVRWDWENDGTWDTGWSATKTASHQYGAAGTKTIKLEVKDTGGATDDTTRTITVTSPPSVTVTVPNGGEDWTVGSIDTIRWSWTGSVGDVKIEYSTDGGSTWSTIESSTQNSGSYQWTVPDAPSGWCKIRISSVSTPSIYDISDADFTISPQVTGGLLQVFARSFIERNIDLYVECLDDSYTFTFAPNDWDTAGVTPDKPYWGKTEDVPATAHMLSSPTIKSIVMDWLPPIVNWAVCIDSIFVVGPGVGQWEVLACSCATYRPDIKVTAQVDGEEVRTYWVRNSRFMVTVCPDRFNEDLWTILRIIEVVPTSVLGMEPSTFGSIKATFK